MAVNPNTANRLARQKAYYYEDGPHKYEEARPLNGIPMTTQSSMAPTPQTVGSEPQYQSPTGRLNFEQFIQRTLPGRPLPSDWQNDPWVATGGKKLYDEYLQSPEGMTAESKKYASDFRHDMSNARNDMVSGLKNQVNQQVSYGMDQVNMDAARKGRGHGGYRLAKQSQVKNQGANAINKGTSTINQGLLDQANSLDEQAISGGIDVQQSQQRLQDSIYANALAQMQADNAAFGGLMGAVGSYYGAYAGALKGK